MYRRFIPTARTRKRFDALPLLRCIGFPDVSVSRRCIARRRNPRIPRWITERISRTSLHTQILLSAGRSAKWSVEARTFQRNFVTGLARATEREREKGETDEKRRERQSGCWERCDCCDCCYREEEDCGKKQKNTSRRFKDGRAGGDSLVFHDLYRDVNDGDLAFKPALRRAARRSPTADVISSSNAK